MSALNEGADDPLTYIDHRRLDDRRDVSDRDDRAVALSAGIGQENGAVVRVQQVLGVTGDAVHDRGQIQRR